MKKDSEAQNMLDEYDFSKGVRGKFAKDYHRGCNVVVLDADVAKHFPNTEAVNQALRTLIGVRKRRTA
jgi:hypothetical protein